MASPSKPSEPEPQPQPQSVPESQANDGAADTSLDHDPDVDMVTVPPEPSSAAANEAPEASKLDGDAQAPEPIDLNLDEARMPLRKDVSLREFLSKMDDYAPVIPDAVTFHALTLAGLPPPPLSSTIPPTNPDGSTNPASTANSSSQSSEPHTPLHLSRLLALATQKFIADIAADAYQYSRMRSGTLTSNTLSALSNPGAPGPSVPAPGGTGAAGGAAGGGGAAGKQAGQHVLGMQRPGFGGGGQGGGQGRTVLTMEDLGMAVGEYGVNVKRGEFYR